jgi:potassium/hydrogen antiporter
MPLCVGTRRRAQPFKLRVQLTGRARSSTKPALRSQAGAALGDFAYFALIGQYLVGGIIVIAILISVARPVTVLLCALPDRRAKWTFEEILFMCWTRETGVIPAALAGLMLGMKTPGAHMIASVTFIAVLMTILIQAPTKKWLAGRLKLLENS